VADLRDLLSAAKCVFFDFDGPICRLFAGHPASEVAHRLRELIAGTGDESVIPSEALETDDPQAVLRAYANAVPGSPLVAELEKLITREEVIAAESSRPTDYADLLIRTFRTLGLQLAVTTNNAPAAVRRYLERRDLTECFGIHIYGRTHDVARLKPDPDCVLRALAGTGVNASEVVLLGDSPADLHAARAAGVAFLGYARNARKLAALEQARAEVIVDSLEAVLTAASDADRG
jgi:HAD superfamily hydrolase (TIGR01509 family)